jgi:hypothetical protein
MVVTSFIRRSATGVPAGSGGGMRDGRSEDRCFLAASAGVREHGRSREAATVRPD